MRYYNQTVLSFFIFIFFAIICILAVSCTKGNTAETDEQTYEPTESQYEDKNVLIGKNNVTIDNNGTAISLEASDNLLILKSLTLNGGYSVLTEESAFSLPESFSIENQFDNFDWKFLSVEPYFEEILGVARSGAVFKFENGKILLNVICRYYLSAGGPFEFATVISGADDYLDDFNIVPGEFASFDFKRTGSEKLVYVSKESGVAEGFVQSNGLCFSGKGFYEENIKNGKTTTIWANMNQNWNGNGYIPITYISSDNKGVYVALEWTSGRINVKGAKNFVRVCVDMDEISSDGGVFVTKVHTGSDFVFPNVYLGVYDGDIEVGSNVFKRWYFAVKSPEKMCENANEPLTQMDMQSGLDTHGVEAVKWDYGWWDEKDRGTCGNWNAYEGSWQLRNRNLKNVLGNYGCSTIKSFSRMAYKSDISLTLYVLLHDTIEAPGKTTDKKGEFNSLTHPEWFSNRTVDWGMGSSADLGNEECVEYLKTAMYDFFAENLVTTWRSDFEPICFYSDKANRHFANGTDVQYWCTVGFGEVCGYLIENINNFRYESCSSGGSMKDLYTATLASVINTEDTANYLSERMAFYDATYVIHPSQLQLPCNIDNALPGNGYYYPKVEQGNMTDRQFGDALIDMEYRTQIMGAPMFSSWSGYVLDKKLEEYTDMYKNKIRPLIREGDLYHILPRPDGKNWDGIMYADSDSVNEIKGCVFLFKPSGEASDLVNIRLRGLDSEKVYHLEFEDRAELNTTATGQSLMTDGIDISFAETIGSDIIWITEK